MHAKNLIRGGKPENSDDEKTKSGEKAEKQLCLPKISSGTKNRKIPVEEKKISGGEAGSQPVDRPEK